MQRNFQSKRIEIGNKAYDIKIRLAPNSIAGIPKLVIVSYLPSPATIPLLQLAIKTIRYFTNTSYELWISDNNSPSGNISWLEDELDINLVLNRTEPKEQGSYANALALELALQFIPPETEFVMTLHQDIAICTTDWLQHLISCFDEQTAAVGVRSDHTRIPEGILHVLGYVFRLPLFHKLKLDFFPDLPAFDTGDKAITEMRREGYKLIALPNTFSDPDVESLIPVGSPYLDVLFDRALLPDGRVFFMHLGRGVNKSTGKYADPKKSIAQWTDFISREVLKETDYQESLMKNIISDPWYSVRRFFVDDFFFKNVGRFPTGARILDMGGKKTGKRGFFNIEKYELEVRYANLSPATEPDFLCDIAAVPGQNNTYDGIILSEVLEHVTEPEKVLAEAVRLLKPGACLLICTPFHFQIHGDPSDFGRYTAEWFHTRLSQLGCKNIHIEKQGLFFGVCGNMLKQFNLEATLVNKPGNRFLKWLLRKGTNWFIWNSFRWDEKPFVKNNAVLGNYTTGFGITCYKS